MSYYKFIFLFFCVNKMMFTSLYGCTIKKDITIKHFGRDVFCTILSFMPADFFLLKWVYTDIQINPDIAHTLINKIKSDAHKKLNNHAIKLIYPNSIDIQQPEKFIEEKTLFLNNLKTCFAHSPKHNKVLLRALLDKEITENFKNGELQIPINRFLTASINISLKKKSLQEEIILLALAKSQDKESSTITLIYNEKNDKNLIEKLLPSLEWKKTSINEIHKNSPYAFKDSIYSYP